MNGFLLTVALLPWVVVGLLCWLFARLGSQLWRNNGRLLKCVKDLETNLADLRNKIAPVPEEAPAPRLAVGAQAPAFELPDPSGRVHSLAQYRGQAVLLVFFAADCAVCTKMLPDLAKAVRQQKHGRPKPLVILSGDEEDALDLIAATPLSCPVLLEGDAASVSESYLVDGTPEAILVDADGRVASDTELDQARILLMVSQPVGRMVAVANGNGQPPPPPAQGAGRGKTPLS